MPEMDSGSIYEFDGFRLLPAQRQLLSADGEPVVVRAKVFELLLYLVQHRGRVVDKSELMEALWPGTVVEENNLNQAASALRQALGESTKSPRFISTITGRGYQFVGKVRETGDDEPTADPAMPMQRIAFIGVALAAIAVIAWFVQRPGEVREVAGVPVLEQFSGLTPRLVTGFHGSHSEPTLSPDGSMIAWVSDVSGTPQIWVKNLQLGDPIQVTDGPYAASSPAWASDNSYILFDRKGSDHRGIFRVGTLGTPEPRRIVDAGFDPAYAGSADAFVFTTGQNVWTANGDGSEAQKVDAVPVGPGFASRQPALSPDGSQVAFVHADGGPLGNLWIAPTSGGEAQQLTSYQLEDGFSVEHPEWAPDGRHIIYSVASRNGGSRLWQISVESKQAAPLTGGAGGANQPAISADGKRLAYTDTRSTWRLTQINPETGQRRALYESRYTSVLPMASPDGRRIVFFAMLPSGAQLFAIGTDGRGLKQLTFDENGTNTLPFWSSDSRSVFYYKEKSLHRLHLDEDRDERVIEDFHWSSRNWAAAHGDQLFFHEFNPDRSVLRGMIRDMRTGEEIELSAPLAGGEWSAAGDELLGFVRGTGLTICEVDTLECQLIMNAGEPISGIRPKWSRNEEQIYYLRHSDKGECCELWVVDRDGTDNARAVELENLDLQNSHFGVDADGMIFYNHEDRSASEIWLVAVE